jgi:hypothetical protein
MAWQRQFLPAKHDGQRVDRSTKLLVSINNWWAQDGSESFWMEITDRNDLGRSLWAPQRDGGGHESWSYSLISFVQPGDRVFHWHKSKAGEPALVGWSEATGPLSVEEKSWQAHGSFGRARGGPTVGPAWVMPLDGLVELDTPLTRTALNTRYKAIVAVMQGASIAARGPAYLPFQNYGGRELRAQQGYLTKFPLALVDLLFSPGLASPEHPSTPSARVSRKQGYLSDAEKRAALERHAVNAAIAHYRAAGASRIEERGKPFDLVVILDGVERHVEVKGSSGHDIGVVQLTQGEVTHAHEWQPTDLVVVDSIACWKDEGGTVLTDGGNARIWANWSPAERDLAPTHLRYDLP